MSGLTNIIALIVGTVGIVIVAAIIALGKLIEMIKGIITFRIQQTKEYNKIINLILQTVCSSFDINKYYSKSEPTSISEASSILMCGVVSSEARSHKNYFWTELRRVL